MVVYIGSVLIDREVILVRSSINFEFDLAYSLLSETLASKILYNFDAGTSVILIYLLYFIQYCNHGM